MPSCLSYASLFSLSLKARILRCFSLRLKTKYQRGNFLIMPLLYVPDRSEIVICYTPLPRSLAPRSPSCFSGCVPLSLFEELAHFSLRKLQKLQKPLVGAWHAMPLPSGVCIFVAISLCVPAGWRTSGVYLPRVHSGQVVLIPLWPGD